MVFPREHMRDCIADRIAIDRTDEVLSFVRAPTPSGKSEDLAAVDLIYQAAEMIKGIQDRADDTEAQAEELIKRACERLQAAETRIQSLEAERRASEAGVNEARWRIHEVEKTLQRVQSRIEAAEAELSAAEQRVETSETRASEAEKALIRIEDAIRTQLLGSAHKALGKFSAAA